MAMGLVDRVAQPGEAVAGAVEFCEDLVAVPQRAMTQTRAMARKHLMEYVRENRQRNADSFFAEWKQPETQGPLQELVERLKKKE
jgi:enoyl-CoA hydratase/carnithine racemase